MMDIADLEQLDNATLLGLAGARVQELSTSLDKAELRRLIKSVDLAALLKLKLPPREPILSPWLTEQSLAMLYAWRGIGKTWLALSIGFAVASGGTVLGWKAPRKYKVLYIDGEMPARVLQHRLAQIVASFEGEPDPDGFRFLTPDLQPNGVMPNLSDQTGQEVIDAHTDGVDLIIVDNLSTMARSGKENEGESWLPVQGWALRHRAQGRAVLFIHHSGKSGQQRGASRREDVLDTVISLKRPAEYQPNEGARFEVHFEKARNLTGDDVVPLEVSLHSEAEKIRWEWKSAENAIVDRIADMVADGATRQEIQTELQLSRFQINRVVKTANQTRISKIVLPDARKGGAK